MTSDGSRRALIRVLGIENHVKYATKDLGGDVAKVRVALLALEVVDRIDLKTIKRALDEVVLISI